MCAVCAARRSQALTLLAGGSCSRCTSGSGLRPPPPPGLALPSRNAGSVSRIWSVFLGAAGAPSGAWPGAGGGRHPPGFPGSYFLPAGGAPGQTGGCAATGKGSGNGWPSAPGRWRPQGPAAGPHYREGETEAWRGQAPCAAP